MEEPQIPDSDQLCGHRGLAKLIKYGIELKIYRQMQSGQEVELEKPVSNILSQI